MLAIVIPARMASTRFPGKPLVDLGGKPMIEWVVQASRAAEIADWVGVVTPDDSIIDACEARGIPVIRTRDDHPSGTDRIAEAASTLNATVYINVQGDEPLISPETIRSVAAPFAQEPGVMMTSVYAECPPEEIDEPAVVKVVLAHNEDALYFSRYPIPYPRNPRLGPVWKHVGIYGYRAELLREFSGWPPGRLESAESLEQLRFLEHGIKIRMALGVPTLGVDTPAQAELVRERLRLGG